jgi:CheY-like chemotaxis protein
MDHTFQAELKTILVVDDRDDCRITTKWFLANFGYAVDSARSAEEALSLFDSKIHDLIITDNSMPGMSGVEMAHVIKLRSPGTPIIMYSGTLPESATCLDVMIKKPAHLLVLKESADRILGARLDHRKQPAS